VVMFEDGVVVASSDHNIAKLFPSLRLVSFLSAQNLLWIPEGSFTCSSPNLRRPTGLRLFLLKDGPIVAGML
jgi:hypothetical protein